MLLIGNSAKKLHRLLEGKYGYKMLPDPYSGKPVLENKDDSIVDLLETMLTKWKEGEGTGAHVDRFLLYYHGHGVQVSGQPCLLTPDWETIPILELVNKIAEFVIAERYYIVTDCCANRRDWGDEDEEIIAKQRVEEAEDAQQHKSLGEKIVNISAVPGGYKASSEEDKMLTSALVSLLEATERGIPLGELKERLRKEQKKQKSRNFPDVKGSLSFGLVEGLFPV